MDTKMKVGNTFDYDLVEKRSINKFKKMNLSNIEDEKEQARIGFYFLALDLILGITEMEEAKSLIIDGAFQKNVNNLNNDDLGIDAVYIDEEDKVVNLFNFKYRNQYSKGTQKSAATLQETSPFLGFISNETEFKKEEPSLDELTCEKIREVIEAKESTDFEYKLFVISNDNTYIYNNDPGIISFKHNYSWLKLINVNLFDFANELAIKPKTNEAKLILNKEEMLRHDMDGYTTATSYVSKVKLVDIVKITTTNLDLRKEESLEDGDLVKTQILDLNTLFDNVRGYVGDTTYNENILRTIEKEPDKFFFYNNGITITADDIKVSLVSMDTKYVIELNNFQIVNGGQTLRIIYRFIEEYPQLINNLATASVLVRFFKTGLEEGLVNKVAEYTNSQNVISPSDLRSVDKIQLDIENHFKADKIKYLRKRTIDSEDDEQYEKSISMEKLGQILLAYNGHPEKSSNNKKKIFDTYYEKIFNNNPEFMKRAIELVEDYYNVVSTYTSLESQYKYYEQKIFYIIYLNRIIDEPLVNLIKVLEDEIERFRSNERISPARKLIQNGFKKSLNETLKQSGYDLISELKL